MLAIDAAVSDWYNHEDGTYTLPKAGKTMPREDVLLLYGSSVYEEVLAFNATLHADYALCSRLIRVNPALRKAFKNAFSYSHFIVCVLGRYDV